MSDFPLLFTVGHRVYSGDGEDANGNTVEVWAPPVAKKVYGWGAPQTSEPKLAGHDRDVVETELLVPPGFQCAAKDRMILDFNPDVPWVEDLNLEHPVIGSPEMFDHNPFGWDPGGIINLKRTNG